MFRFLNKFIFILLVSFFFALVPLTWANEKSDKVDRLFTHWNRTGSPGAAVAIVQDGAIKYENGYGFANLEYNIPITPSTPFNIASVSKQFTAMAIFMLVEQGKLALDEDYRKCVPEMPNYGETVTIKHLLNHTSGLRSYTSLLPIAGWRRLEDTITREDVFRMILRQKGLDFSPGEGYRYSNTGYFLLAEIVARASGMSFREWMNKNIFQPLKMTKSDCQDDYERLIKDRAYGYKQDEFGGYKKEVQANGTVGAGNIFTPAEDLAKWIIYLEELKGRNESILNYMLQRGVLKDGSEMEYACGFYIDKYKGLPVVRHAGGSAGFASEVIWFLEQHFAVILLSNISDLGPTDIAKKIADIYISDCFEDTDEGESQSGFPKISLDMKVTEHYVGVYKHKSGVKMRVYMEDKNLMISVPGWGPTMMQPVSKTLFSVSNETQRFSFQENDSGGYDLVLHQDGKEHYFPKIEVLVPTPELLEEYVGEYYSEELQTIYRIVVQNDRLVAIHLKNEDVFFLPEDTDIFSSNKWWLKRIRFNRDKSDRIIGLEMDGFRTTNLKFVKR